MKAISVIIFFFCLSEAFAAHPLITDDTGTQGKGHYQVEVTGEYSYNRQDGVTEKVFEVKTALTAGLKDNLDIVISMPYQFLSSKERHRSKITENGISDTTVELKAHLYEKEGLSFALKPGITLPSGREEKGLGEGRPGFSIVLITTKEIEPVIFHVNLGYTKNRKELRDILHYSLAGEYGMGESLKIVANIGGESNPDRESNNHPAFMLCGLIFSMNQRVDLDLGLVGFKAGLNRAAADYSILAGLTWKF